MHTRAATKQAGEKAAQSLSSPPITPPLASTKNDIPLEPVTTKRKRGAKNNKVAQTMKGDWDVLPHGLGKKGDLEDTLPGDTAQQIDASPAKRPRRGKASTKKYVDTVMTDVKREVSVEMQRGIDEKLAEDHKAFTNARANAKLKEKDGQDTKPTKKRSPHKKKAADTSNSALQKTKKKEKKKKHPYGLTPGASPFPNHAKPTQGDCEEVYRLLSEMHGEVKAPDVIPPPSMEVTGCGEVPDLLDALLRTLLSAATTSNNSNMALQGLKNTFGLRTEGIGKGSIKWEAVREADLDKVILSIKSGGLAKAKGTNIKKILDAVYERNLARFNDLTKEMETGEPAQVLGAKHETTKQKETELARFKDNMLTLDYLFELTTDEVMDELTQLPGIGVKTSSCVILFCMKRPSFAVDTHVWRHCKWLDWVPEKATRDQTFSHCEVTIPDELKYALHQLFIQHGKKCPRCRANTGPGSEDWDDAECPIEHLVKRTGKMKVKGASPAKKSKGKKAESSKETDDEAEAEESDVAMEDLTDAE